MTPWIAAAILKDEYERALWLLFAAGWTDFFDGFLARHFRLNSRFGAYADPVADKVLLSTIYVCLGIAGAVPGWFVALVLGRDVLILAMAAIALMFTGVRRFPPSIWGKISTVVQIVAAVGVMTERAGLLERVLPIRDGLIAITTVTTAWSGLHYLWRGWSVLRESPARSSSASADASRPR
jgi:cardiolipin synthase